MDEDQVIVTQEGLDKLKKELLDGLEKRKKIAETIEHAKNLGDLSENFEYQEAKEEQSHNETRILILEDTLRRAVISDNSQKGNGDYINLGSKVKVKIDGQTKEFEIVSFNEADPVKGKISNESPLGQAFLGKKSGDKVEVEVPRGKVTYEILEVK
jgi:transcription elongation factor GreA